jgi:hypothetical protein
MKKIIVTLAAVLTMTTAKSQTNEIMAVTHETVASCSLIFSEDIETMISKNAEAFTCSEIIIETLPSVSYTYTPLTVDFAVKGHYTFVKSPSLDLPPDYKVYFEDNLTGQVFDLVNSNSFTFMVNRSIPKRFILRIEKQPKLYAKSK